MNDLTGISSSVALFGIRASDNWDLRDGVSEAEAFLSVEGASNSLGLRGFAEATASVSEWTAKAGLRFDF